MGMPHARTLGGWACRSKLMIVIFSDEPGANLVILLRRRIVSSTRALATYPPGPLLARALVYCESANAYSAQSWHEARLKHVSVALSGLAGMSLALRVLLAEEPLPGALQ